ncbi:MAG: hypothetical protein ABJ208_19845, partial [Rhodopirellula bahusiensis]
MSASKSLSFPANPAPTALKEFSLTLQSESYRYRTPMKFGGRVVEEVTVLTAECIAKNQAGQSADGDQIGVGSMTMGVTWAWPDASLTDDTKLEVVLELASRMAAQVNEASGTLSGHPMEICLQLASQRDELVAAVSAGHELTAPIPELAILLAASPIEAALFDAHGKAAGQSSYSLLSAEHLPPDLGAMTGD